ncbi:MAG TPA: CDP-alcohol phosphatidyltransferase family protein [Candidatus Angelobacter sp.]|jgi:cardiolipin synthase|nr:CDP-alcohol phosphatidyltransferase family protein [Candidatus Angelobacter sp.]
MLRQLKSAPNLLTLLRLIFVPFVVVAIQQQKYAWALGIFITAGITDGLDGLLARVLKQKTTLGQYLDPIADKLLLSTMFLMLSIAHIIRWPVTIMVFSRDIIILIVCTLLYATGTMRVFRPSWFGKANTAVQILSVPLALIYQINFSNWSRLGKRWSIYATVALTTISGVHYVLRLALDLRSPGNKTESSESTLLS